MQDLKEMPDLWDPLGLREQRDRLEQAEKMALQVLRVFKAHKDPPERQVKLVRWELPVHRD
jgi:hypothetical protein